MALSPRYVLLLVLIALILFSYQAHAFGAGNIASISAVEGKNWRHGDIEDVLKTVSCIKHHKWNSMMIKRVYFGNWLRDYSQAMDTGALKKAQPETIRILVWLLSFLSFGYATAEFEVTSERLGVYRPEEHIDNPKDYNDNEDARKYDPRLRGPIRDVELQVDPETGMKNYIANGKGDWATSAAFVKYSFERSIHHGRFYTNGHGFFKGKDEDLAEALRCLGQGLHTLEDFGAHTNYVELSLRELGFNNVFSHTGTATMIQLRGKHVFPLVTGTFGMVDFYHSVLGEATDHFTQSEVNEMDNALGTAQTAAQSSNPLVTLVKLLSKVPGTRELCAEAEQLQNASQAQARSLEQAGGYVGQGSFRGGNDYGSSQGAPGDWDQSRASQPDWNASQAAYPSQPPSYDAPSWGQPQQPNWQQSSQDWSQHQPQFNSPQHPQSFNMQDPSQFPGAQHQWNDNSQQSHQQQWNMPSQQQQQTPSQPAELHTNPQPTPSQPLQQPQSAPGGLPGMPNFDPVKTIAQIYPILAFRDKVVRTISSIIEKIPGLEALVDRITETLTVFVLSLLAPFVRPILTTLTKTLQSGSTEVLDSSAKHQFEVWTNPHSTDPTHSMLSKDHFSNILNSPAGSVAAEIVKFIAPRVLYAWEHPNVPVQQVMTDVESIFHHPAIRNEHNECHRNMFQAVRTWVDSLSDRGRSLDSTLSSEGVKSGKNHKAGVNEHIAMQPAGQQHQQQQQQQSQGGFGGFVNSFTGGGGQGGGQHGGSNNSPFGQIGNLVSSFAGGGHGGQQQQQSHQQSSSGGLGDVLNLASKLPIPGMQNINKYSKYANMASSFGGGGKRGLDDDGLREIGGSREMHDALAHPYPDGAEATRGLSPSPGPMAPPAGYEMYGQGSNAEYGPQAGGGGGAAEGFGYQDPGQGQWAGHEQQQQQQQQQYGTGSGDFYDQNQSQSQSQGYGGGAGHSDNYYR